MANEIKLKKWDADNDEWVQQYPEVRHTDIVASGSTPSSSNFLRGDGSWSNHLTGELKLGDVANDNYLQIEQIGDDFGFDFQHNNASSIQNLQGGTNQALVLGDVSKGDTSTLLGASILASGSWTKYFNLTGAGELYIGSGATSQVWHHDIFEPIVDNLDLLPAYSNSNEDTISYNTTERAIELQSSSDGSMGLVYPALKTESGVSWKISFSIKASASASTGVYFRIAEYDSALADGKTHISHDATLSAVQEDTRQRTNFHENQDIGTDWEQHSFFYTPTSTAVWFSPLFLNWSGLGTNALYIKNFRIFAIQEDSADANTLDGLDSTQFLRSDQSDTMSGDLTLSRNNVNTSLTINSGTASSIINMNGTGTSFIEKDTGNDLYIAHNVSDKAIHFRVNDGGTQNVLMTLNGSSSRVGIGTGTSNPSEKLQVVGNIKTSGNLIFDDDAENSDYLIDFHENPNGNWGAFIRYDGSVSNALEIGTRNNGTETQAISVDRNTADVTFNNDVTVQGDLTVNGTTTTLDTTVSTTDQWTVTNAGTDIATIINQTGTADILDVQDNGTSVFKVKDGGDVELGGNLNYRMLQYQTTSNLNSAGDSSGFSVFYGLSSASNKPSGTDHSVLTMSYSSGWQTQLAGDWRTKDLYYRTQENGTWKTWAKMWHSDNDGSGSGLDADTVDGKHAYQSEIRDTRNDGDVTPNDFTDKTASFSFTDDIANSPNVWDSVLTMKGWTDNYRAWQLFSNSSTSGDTDENLYFRTGIGTSWGNIKRVLTDADIDDFANAYHWTVSNINYIDNGGTGAGYRKIMDITTSDQLGVGGVLYATGTSGSVVINAKFEILVNHSADIVIKSISGGYTQARLKVQSDNNEHCEFLFARQRNDTNDTPVDFTFIPFRWEDSVTTYTNSPTPSYGSNANLEHLTVAFGTNITATGGSTAKQYIEGNEVLTTAGGTMTALTLDTGGSSATALTIKGTTPTISLLDDDSGADDFYLHANSNNFYVLADRDGSNLVGAGYDVPHPLQLEADTDTAYTFGNKIITDTTSTQNLNGDINMGANTIDFNANSGNSTTAQIIGDRSATDLDTRNFTTEGGFSYTTFDGSTSNKPSGSYNNANGVITMNTHSGAYNWQLAFTNNQGKMFARYRNGGSYSSWNEIFTSASTIDADTLSGYAPQESASANSIAKRDGNGDLKVRDIRANGAVYSNFDQGANDSYVYFGDSASQTGHYLRFNHSGQEFQFSNRVIGTAGRLSAVEITENNTTSDVDKINFALSGSTLTITTS